MAKHEQTTFPEGHMAEVLDFKEPLANREVTQQINAANRRPHTYETAAEEQRIERELVKKKLAALAGDVVIPLATITDIDPYLLEKNLGEPFGELPQGLHCEIKALPVLLTTDEQEELAVENFENTGGDIDQIANVRITPEGNMDVYIAPVSHS